MGWISDKLPPNGLKVLVECSGYCDEVGAYADHAFKLGWYIIPEDETEGEWYVDSENKISYPTVHAWMPLPKHFAPREIFTPYPDMMEHSMLDDEPEYLYKNEVYEQMTFEDFMREAENGKAD